MVDQGAVLSGVQSVWLVLNSTLQQHRNGKAADKASPEDMNDLLLTFAGKSQ